MTKKAFLLLVAAILGLSQLTACASTSAPGKKCPKGEKCPPCPPCKKCPKGC